MDQPTRDRIDDLRRRKAEYPPLTHAEIAAASPYTVAYVKAVLNRRNVPAEPAATLDAIEAAIEKARRRQAPVEDRHGRGFAVAE